MFQVFEDEIEEEEHAFAAVETSFPRAASKFDTSDRTENLPPTILYERRGLPLGELAAQQPSTETVNNDQEGDESPNPFDKYWNVQLPPAVPSSSTSSSKMTHDYESEQMDRILKSPTASRLLSPSTRKAISSVYKEEYENNLATNNVSSMGKSILIQDEGLRHEGNFEDYVHTSFGTSIRKRRNSNPGDENVGEQYLFGEEDDVEEPPPMYKQEDQLAYDSPLKKRKMIMNAGNAEDMDLSLNISPPPTQEQPEDESNPLFADASDHEEHEQKPPSPDLEMGLYTGRSKSRKSRLIPANLDEETPLDLSPIPATAIRTGRLSSNLNKSPLLKYTVPSSDDIPIISRSFSGDFRSRGSTSLLVNNESVRERDAIIDKLNSDYDNERRKTKEMKMVIEKYEHENRYLSQQNNYFKEQYERMAELTEEIEKQKNLEIDLLNEKLFEQQERIKELEVPIKNQRDSNIAEIEEKLSGICTTVNTLKSEIQQKDSQIEILTNQVASLNRQLEEANKSKADLFTENQSQKYEHNILNQKYDGLVFKMSGLDKKLEEFNQLEVENKDLRNSLSERNEERRKTRELELEFQKIKTVLESQDKLKEEILDLQSQLSEIEQLKAENQILSNQKSELSLILNKWELAFKDQAPADVEHTIKLHTNKITIFEERIQEMISEKQDLCQRLDIIQQELNSKACDIIQLQTEKDILEDKLKNSEVKLHSMQQQLESSQQFAHINDKEKAIESQEEDKTEHYLNRISSLENIIEANQVDIKGLYDKVETLQITVNEKNNTISTKELEIERNRKLIAEMKVKIEEYESRVEKLEKVRDELETEVARYEQRLGRGEYHKEKTKILHMTINPETEAKSKSTNDVERLKTENKLLNEQLLTLKQQLETANTFVVSSLEINKLREENADAQRRITKLKEVFQKKINEFRKSVYLLFGFRVDVLENNRIRLSSMYAESPEDYLLFESDGNTTMNLLSSEFAMTIDDKIMRYLNSFRSIPGFLCSVTLDLFNKQTVFTQ